MLVYIVEDIGKGEPRAASDASGCIVAVGK